MSTKMSEIGQSNKAEVLSGYLMERLTQLLRDIVDVVEDAVSEYREETLRTRLENESLRRQLGEFLRPPDELWARPQPPSSNKHLVARDQEQVCAATHVQTLPASTSKRTGAELPRPDETFSKAHFVIPAPTLREEPRPPSPLVIKREQDELKVTPRKNCAELPVASVHVHFKGNADASTVMERQQTERNGQAAAGAIVYECPRCGEVFAQAARLRLHLEQKRKTYACNWCCKSFAQSADLRRHMRTHTGERPHRCTFCAKSFSQRGNLRRHVRIHTGERPYTCAVCRRTFSDGDTLKKHMRTYAHQKARDGHGGAGT